MGISATSGCCSAGEEVQRPKPIYYIVVYLLAASHTCFPFCDESACCQSVASPILTTGSAHLLSVIWLGTHCNSHSACNFLVRPIAQSNTFNSISCLVRRSCHFTIVFLLLYYITSKLCLHATLLISRSKGVRGRRAPQHPSTACRFLLAGGHWHEQGE